MSNVGILRFHRLSPPLFLLLSVAVSGAGPKNPSKTAAKPPLDFSGVWELDAKMSINVSSRMKGAVLSVAQRDNRIWISPVKTVEGARQAIQAEEIVVDGAPHEKTIGPAGKGLVRADWAKDGKSLWIEVRAGPPEDPKATPLQRSVWKLSEDRMVWVRESVSLSEGDTRSARLVFHRKKPEGK